MEEDQNVPWTMILRRLSSELFRIFKKRIREQVKIKLTIDEYALLLAINEKGDNVIQKNMAEAMGKDQSVVLKLIDSLEKKKLVKRIIGLNDRRKNFLVITKKGEEVLEQYMKIELTLIDELHQDIPRSEIENFRKILLFIRNKAEKM
ncbi:MAG: MarR family winged helix-turn-helix transcriptional regulator [Prolixibacteraceae bacterium]